MKIFAVNHPGDMVETVNLDVGGDCLLLVSLLSLFVGDLLIIYLLEIMLVWSCLVVSESDTCSSGLFLYSNNWGCSDQLKQLCIIQTSELKWKESYLFVAFKINVNRDMCIEHMDILVNITSLCDQKLMM